MTQSFKDQRWEQRLDKLGDEAETVFETWADAAGIGYHRSGINRPPFNVAQLPRMVAYTPDYLTEDGYIEVQGFGRDGVIKLKHDKLIALQQWDQVFQTEMFLWDNQARQIAVLPIGWFSWNHPDSMGKYPEGKTYSIWERTRVSSWKPYNGH